MVLLFSCIVKIDYDTPTKLKVFEKFILELLIMLTGIFIFSKFNLVNLLVAIGCILVFSYMFNNSLFNQEKFQLKNTSVRNENTLGYYEFNHLYPHKFKDADSNKFETVEPEEPSKIFFENESITPEELNIYIPKIDERSAPVTTTSTFITTTTSVVPATDPLAVASNDPLDVTSNDPLDVASNDPLNKYNGIDIVTEQTLSKFKERASGSFGNFMIGLKRIFL
jgi:hypothetical protein